MEDIDRERERGDKAVKRVGENSGGLLRQTDRERERERERESKAKPSKHVSTPLPYKSLFVVVHQKTETEKEDFCVGLGKENYSIDVRRRIREETV
jgi:hypothetical protein